MNVYGIHALGLTVELTSVIALAQHDRKITHCRTESLRHRVSFRRKRKGVLALRVCQSLSKIGNGIVQRQETHRQLRLFGLLLLVLGSLLLGAPFVLLQLVHLVNGAHLTHPRIYHRVDVSLARRKIARNICNQVQSFLLTVNVKRHARCQCTDAWTDGRHHRHSQLRPYGSDRFTDPLRHLSS